MILDVIMNTMKSGVIWMNKYEIECTSRYEGIYTEEEIALNNQLYAECSKETLDCEAIEYLLKKGADPLGGTAVSGWDLLVHIYGEIVSESQGSKSINLPRITELFLKYGMDIDHPRIPYDDDNSLHPMWEFAFVMNENSVYALKMLLDAGISADAVGEMWGHATFDMINIHCGDPNDDEFWNYECVWLIKMIMLCASYDHVLDQDEDLRKFIGCAYNHYDIKKFREWDNYRYEFDTSRCSGSPELYKSVVNIIEVDSNEVVWRIGIFLKEGEF